MTCLFKKKKKQEISKLHQWKRDEAEATLVGARNDSEQIVRLTRGTFPSSRRSTFGECIERSERGDQAR
ncbi:hypothetical protein RND71_039030 [Anisodus tanguticus]|uniref:Uncharacterized protein n=1 Tax=Anisodus tanguticus TaxID=243964 RepID=A0AAE1R072_9SOLA|nr:hypothetical protein RND71_039030 [Anisodus tanguticus]